MVIRWTECQCFNIIRLYYDCPEEEKQCQKDRVKFVRELFKQQFLGIPIPSPSWIRGLIKKIEGRHETALFQKCVKIRRKRVRTNENADKVRNIVIQSGGLENISIRNIAKSTGINRNSVVSILRDLRQKETRDRTVQMVIEEEPSNDQLILTLDDVIEVEIDSQLLG